MIIILKRNLLQIKTRTGSFSNKVNISKVKNKFGRKFVGVKF